jgi:hypothetical protein
MEIRFILVFSLLLVGSASREVRACACSDQILNDRDAASEQFKGAAVVFQGEVVSVTLLPTPRGASFGLSEITFRVIQSYKAAAPRLLRFMTLIAVRTAEPGMGSNQQPPDRISSTLWYVFITVWLEGTWLTPTMTSLIVFPETVLPVWQAK